MGPSSSSPSWANNAAFWLFIAAALTDWLDGKIARERGIVSDFGRFMDAVIDKLRDAGQCILFSSHVMQEVAMLCDDVVVIAHGTVVAQGTPDGLRERAGEPGLEDAFVKLIGSGEGLG